ncbi:BMT2 [Mytilus coruscus]|uniref:S-adenosylmethionine sensor upstream of mTORC1 n=1 Tax=Mytilus coruscus TaxID=42192 RepID=A0A6J8EKD3_MYTCO|nr:BMT2 [Mytilus coruscus]
MDREKEEHLRLAAIIKGVHADLRKKYQNGSNDLEEIWKNHCSDQSVLTEYADAMYNLSCNHWSKLPETRIDWCRATIMEYFYNDGLKKALEKEQRRHAHRLRIKLASQDSNLLGRSEENRKSIMETDSRTTSNNVQGDVFSTPYFQELQIDGKIRLLDVGSCFNPFARYDDFLAVGIDIGPATPNVLCCDFLQLETTCPLEIDFIESYLQNLKSPVTELPKNSFHVIVFSLLLEYLPSPDQRWICCLKANELLHTNGLFLIITPDSHKQHRNAAMIKSWKEAIESIGFKQWRYVKLEHLHCLAFRKSAKTEDLSLDLNVSAGMLYIPQDFHDLSESTNLCEYSEEDEKFFMDSVGELPGFLSYDEN